jgi:hypothetical protein
MTIKTNNVQVGTNAVTPDLNIVLAADEVTGDLVINKGTHDGALTEIQRIRNDGSGMSYIPAGVGAVTTTVQGKLRESVSVLDFYANGVSGVPVDPMGVVDSTLGIQAAIDYAKGTKQVLFPAGTYRITSTLNLYKGSNLKGVNKSQGWWEYSSGFVGTKIMFNPTVASDLFTIKNLPAPTQDFKGHVSVGGMYIQGDSNPTAGFARRAFDLNLCIYGNFYDLEIIYFWSAFLCTDTINNRFNNIRVASCTNSCVEYAGTAPPTTDVWDQCSFQLSPIGVRFTTGGIGIRFVSCLWEALDSYGMVLSKECRAIQVVDGYAEDVPYVNNSAGSMFNVGVEGAVSSLATMLQVTGGSFSGRNAGPVGSFLDVDTCSGVQLTGVYVARYTNLIKASTNTANYAVACSGIQFNSVTTLINNYDKYAGFLDFSAINAGFGPIARFNGVVSVNATNQNTITTSFTEVQGGSNSQGQAVITQFSNPYPVVALGTRLRIPFVSQGSINHQVFCKVKGISSQFNSTVPVAGFEVSFSVCNLASSSLGSLVSWGGGGNFASISINGMFVEIAFSAAYTGATANGVMVFIEYLSAQKTLAVNTAGITMN